MLQVFRKSTAHDGAQPAGGASTNVAKRRWRKVAVKGAVLLVATLVSLVLAEGVVRWLYKDTTILFPRYHTKAQYGDFQLRRLRPNSEFWHTSVDGSWKFVTNSQGFRSQRDYDYEKPAGTTRIICLGDSNTQGFEVRQDFTFNQVIEKYLRRRGHEVEVMNTGISGFSTAEQLAFLENEGIKYKPDFVVLAFSANDVRDNVRANLFRLENGSLVVNRTKYAPGVSIQDFIYAIPTVQWLSENSYFYSLLFNTVWDYAKVLKYQRAKQRLEREKGQVKNEPEEITESAIAIHQDYSGAEIALATKLLERLHQFCKDHGIRLIILEIPQKDLTSDGILPAFPPALLDAGKNSCDHFVAMAPLLKEFEGVVELHVPHGRHHISEFVHGMLGVAVARKIQEEIQ